MILRMESSLMRTLKMKDRLCYRAIKGDGKKKTDTVRWIGYLVVAMEVIAEAQEGIQGTRPSIMPPDLCQSKILRIGIFLHQKGPRCPDV